MTGADEQQTTPSEVSDNVRGPTLFEAWLWRSRSLVLGAIVVIAVLAVAALALAAVDTVYLVRQLAGYVAVVDPTGRDLLRGDLLTSLIKALDEALIAALLVVVALGLYELFMHPLPPPAGARPAGRLLHVTSLEDLKDRVAKLIVLVLAGEFFQLALDLTQASALELLWVGGGILLVSAALALTTLGGKRAGEQTKAGER